jgi:hypothetical protein
MRSFCSIGKAPPVRLKPVVAVLGQEAIHNAALRQFNTFFEYRRTRLLAIKSAHKEKIMALKRFIIEREIPKVGGFDAAQLSGAAAKSNEALCEIGAADIQWVNSYVTADKTFCVYLAKDESAIRKHAEISGFPANKITEVSEVIDPTTAS